MSFIRPELLRTANRWRESFAGAGAAAFGAILWLTGAGPAQLVGTVLVIGGALLVFAGLQRARFRRGGGGAGVVRLDEGRLAYFGPVEGGVVAVADLSAVDLVSDRSGVAWHLEADGADALRIPVDAEGADSLFDVFGALPGLDTPAMLRAAQNPAPGRTLIWARRAAEVPRIGAH